MDKKLQTLLKTMYPKVAGKYNQDDLTHIAHEMQHGGHGGMVQAFGLTLQRADSGYQRGFIDGMDGKFNFDYYLNRWEQDNPEYFEGLLDIALREGLILAKPEKK